MDDVPAALFFENLPKPLPRDTVLQNTRFHCPARSRYPTEHVQERLAFMAQVQRTPPGRQAEQAENAKPSGRRGWLVHPSGAGVVAKLHYQAYVLDRERLP